MNPRSLARWLILTALAVGGAAAVVSLTSLHLRDYRRFAQSPSEATGVVTGDGGLERSNRVFYRFEARGRSWMGDSRVRATASPYRVGSPLTIYYLASDPAVNSVTKPAPGGLEAEAVKWGLIGFSILFFAVLLAHRLLAGPKQRLVLADTSGFSGWWTA